MRLIIALAAVCLSIPAQDVLVLQNAVIHPVSRPDIARGAIVINGDRIQEVGEKVRLPRGARIMDLKGLHVYPGLVNAATELGLVEISAVTETRDLAELGDFNPQLQVAGAINPASEHIPVVRANGITAALTRPLGGILSGRAALIHTHGWTWEEMLIERHAAMAMQFPTLRFTPAEGRPPQSPPTLADRRRRYEERLRELRQFFADARRYAVAKKEGARDFRPDLKFEAMLAVLDGNLPLLIEAQRAPEIRAALDFAEREQVKIILANVRDPGDHVQRIAKLKIPVLLSTLELPLHEDDPYDAAFTLPAQLHAAGIKIAFGSFSSSGGPAVQFARNLPYQAAQAVAFGLPYDVALRAITLSPAEIFGVADRIGSIEKGKWADLIVTDGDPLEVRTQLLHVFIKGREVSLDNRHKRLYEQYRTRP
jgi:imidazolonepropionase-like amidohydrolase